MRTNSVVTATTTISRIRELEDRLVRREQEVKPYQRLQRLNASSVAFSLRWLPESTATCPPVLNPSFIQARIEARVIGL
jgi:hypothetical protein